MRSCLGALFLVLLFFVVVLTILARVLPKQTAESASGSPETHICIGWGMGTSPFGILCNFRQNWRTKPRHLRKKTKRNPSFFAHVSLFWAQILANCVNTNAAVHWEPLNRQKILNRLVPTPNEGMLLSGYVCDVSFVSMLFVMCACGRRFQVARPALKSSDV